jgi:GxxExxY protein
VATKELKEDVSRVAKRVYATVGPGHEETIYREAMNVELQEAGYIVKTEMPISIRYQTTNGKDVIIGSGKIDLYIEKDGGKAIIELKAVTPLIKAKKSKEQVKEYAQLVKYLQALAQEDGFLINFPFPPKEDGDIELIESSP